LRRWDEGSLVIAMDERVPRSATRVPPALVIALIVSIGWALVATVGLVLVATSPKAGDTVQSAPASTVADTPAPAPIPAGNPASHWYQNGHLRGVQAAQQHGGLYSPDQALVQCQAYLGHDPVAPDDIDWFGGCVAGMTGK
jgi:hypothetical protein